MAQRATFEDATVRRLVGRLIGGAIVAGAAVAVVVTLLQWETRPQTDDATVRANFVGIAPQVSGHIVELRVRDNQRVQEGELLFVVDPRPYKIALARAQANLALTRKEVEGLRNGLSTPEAGVAKASAQREASAADIVRREADPVSVDAEIARLEAQRAASGAAVFRSKPDLKDAEDYAPARATREKGGRPGGGGGDTRLARCHRSSVPCVQERSSQGGGLDRRAGE